jgi:hypothetical protein
VEQRNTCRSTTSSFAVNQATIQKKTSLLFVIVVISWPIATEHAISQVDQL